VGPYEKIKGRLYYWVDPDKEANARIVDLRLAPRSARGRVEFAGDFVLLKPVDLAKGNHRLLYDVNNRGGLVMLSRLNDAAGSNDPSTPAHAGNGFLMKQGYSLLWSAWNWDVAPGGGRLQIELPVASNGGRPITGRVVAEITVDRPSRSEAFAWGNSRCYEVADPQDHSTAVLSVRDEQRAARVEIPRQRWRFADATHLALDPGFEPGRIYELIYVAKEPRVVGLGLAAIRDAIAFFRWSARDHEGTPNPLTLDGRPDAERAYVFGVSQSGRVIQHMLFEGFHVDERGRMVFDAAMPHVAGGGKGSFNHRFAQTTRHASHHEDHQYPADFFPFNLAPQTDPVTGQSGDVLAVAKELGKVPLLMYTGTSTEYWTRSTSLLHTDVTGTKDAAVDERSRIYFVAGARHGNSTSRSREIYEHPGNTLDHSPPLRALLLALDYWATAGTKPPDSLYPRIDRGELVSAAEHRRRFPAIPGLRHVGANLQPPRLDFGPRFWSEGIIDRQPPAFGEPYVTLVPNVDKDGNELGGIRLPDVSVPLGTYMGWNPRRPEFGAPDKLGRWAGSFLPFALTEAEREQARDPRPAIESRYPTKQRYVDAVAAEAEKLRKQRFLLREDAEAIVARARALAWPPRFEE
jgi:hypothetical protein